MSAVLGHRCRYQGCCVGLTPGEYMIQVASVRTVSAAHAKAAALVKTLRDMATYANANPRESFPGVGDLDDVTDKAQELRDLLEDLT